MTRGRYTGPIPASRCSGECALRKPFDPDTIRGGMEEVRCDVRTAFRERCSATVLRAVGYAAPEGGTPPAEVQVVRGECLHEPGATTITLTQSTEA